MPGLVALLVTLGAATPAPADEIYFSVTGQLQGKIPGEVAIKGMEGKMKGLSFSHELETARDPVTGQGHGSRHGPVRLTREWGKASPRLVSALLSNEPLNVTIEIYTPRQAVVSGVTQTTMVMKQAISLGNAVVSRLSREAKPSPDGVAGQLQPLETLEFVYQTVKITDSETGVSASDSWIVPN